MEKQKNRKLFAVIKAMTLVCMFLAIVLNINLSSKTIFEPATVKAVDPPKPKAGPRTSVDCTYTDGASTSVSLGFTDSGLSLSISHNSGTKKAGVKLECKKTDTTDCTARACGPKA